MIYGKFLSELFSTSLIKYNKNSEEINVEISDEHTDFAFVSHEELQNFNISDKFMGVINKSMGFDDE